MPIEYSDCEVAKTRFNHMPLKSSNYSKESNHQMRFPAPTEQQYQSCLIDTEKLVLLKVIMFEILVVLDVNNKRSE